MCPSFRLIRSKVITGAVSTVDCKISRNEVGRKKKKEIELYRGERERERERERKKNLTAAENL